MTRRSIDIDDETLAAAQRELGTSTLVGTVNAALQLAADRAKAREAIALLDTVEFDLEDSDRGF